MTATIWANARVVTMAPRQPTAEAILTIGEHIHEAPRGREGFADGGGSCEITVRIVERQSTCLGVEGEDAVSRKHSNPVQRLELTGAFSSSDADLLGPQDPAAVLGAEYPVTVRRGLPVAF